MISRDSIRRIAALAMMLLTFSAAANAQRPDTVAVRAAMTEFMDALNALDLARMSADFTEDVTAFVPTAQADRAEGRAAVTEIFHRFVEKAKLTATRQTLVPEDVKVEVSGSLAVVHFMIREVAPRPTRRRTFVFRRVGTRWLISHFHASDLVSPAP
jgi:ketosteroid isomerase-like protein